MRTITTTTEVYKFDELPISAQAKVLEKHYDINVSYRWWDNTYEDARNVGIKINGFDLDRKRQAFGELTDSCYYTASKILLEHGGDCGTYKTADKFVTDYNALFERCKDPKRPLHIAEGEEEYFDKIMDDLETQFKYDILEDYSIILQNECDYLMGEEAIKETIRCNEYEFDINGNII